MRLVAQVEHHSKTFMRGAFPARIPFSEYRQHRQDRRFLHGGRSKGASIGLLGGAVTPLPGFVNGKDEDTIGS